MKKLPLFSLIVAVTAFTAEEPKSEATNLEEAFKLATIKGEFRSVYQSNSNYNSDGSTKDILLGGKIGFETSPLNGISVGATFYSVNSVLSSAVKDLDYYDNADKKGYSLLGEAFAKYSFGAGEIKVGRMELDLPLINSDDIRMIPDLYTAVIASYSPLKGVKLTAGTVTQMAGWENLSDESKFAKLGQIIRNSTGNSAVWNSFFASNNSASDSKLYITGVTYEQDSYGLQGWFSRQTDIMDTYYLTGSVKPYESDTISINLMAQYMKETSIGELDSYSNQAGNSATKIDSNIYGAAIGLESKKTGLNGVLAYNKAGKKLGTLNDGGTSYFFGGAKDPLFTSADVETANGAGGVSAYKYQLGYDFSKIGFDGLNTTLAHANFDKLNNQNSKESDLIIMYELNKQTNIAMMLSKIEITGQNDNNRARVFIKYGFGG